MVITEKSWFSSWGAAQPPEVYTIRLLDIETACSEDLSYSFDEVSYEEIGSGCIKGRLMVQRPGGHYRPPCSALSSSLDHLMMFSGER